MCLYSWVLAHLRPRHLYNSICLTVKLGGAKHWHDVKKREREMEPCAVWAVAESKPISEQRLHLRPVRDPRPSPAFYYAVTPNQSLTTAESVKVPFFDRSGDLTSLSFFSFFTATDPL